MPIAHIKKQGPWFVVSMRGRWKKDKIERSHKPCLLFHSVLKAAEEACRLVELHPRQNYAIFECIGFVKQDYSGNPDLPIETTKAERRKEKADMGIGFKTEKNIVKLKARNARRKAERLARKKEESAK